MKKFLFKCLIFLFPFMALFFVEIFILPIDFFTFRVWEALRIYSLQWILPGYFYPRFDIYKVEEGELVPYTEFSMKRYVQWHTDRYGYRKKDNPPETKYKIVIIGDSNVAGTGLTQDQTIFEVLGKKMNTDVYPISPGSINTFLKDIRFIEKPPGIVILARIEREITTLRNPKSDFENLSEFQKILDKIQLKIKTNPYIQTIAVYIDRMLKWNLLHYSRAELRRVCERFFQKFNKNNNFENKIESKYLFSNSMFFLQGSEANKDVPEKDIKMTVEIIQRYNDILKKRNIRFIFLPIPNKENVYYDLLPEKKKPAFLRKLITNLKDAGVETIDTQKAFDDAYRKRGVLVYFHDDSHWNVNGVHIAADLLVKQINQKK